MKAHSCTQLVATAALLFTLATDARAKDSAELVPLKLYWSASRADYLTVASADGERDAKERGYELLRTEGYVFSTRQPGTVPLNLYLHEGRKDFFLTGTTQSEGDAQRADYRFVRVEGYVYPAQQPSTFPLKTFSNGHENFAVSSRQGELDANAKGYQFHRVEGFVIRDPHAYLLDQPIDYIPLLIERRGLAGKEIVLEDDERLVTPANFRPPVEIVVVAKTDSTNLRIGYAAEQVIFNWELDPKQLRVDGGPAWGRHRPGAGLIPAGQFVTIRWLVTDEAQAIYVDDQLRFLDVDDYSAVNQPASVFPAVHSTVTVKSVRVRRLPEGTDIVSEAARSSQTASVGR